MLTNKLIIDKTCKMKINSAFNFCLVNTQSLALLGVFTGFENDGHTVENERKM